MGRLWSHVPPGHEGVNMGIESLTVEWRKVQIELNKSKAGPFFACVAMQGRPFFPLRDSI